jgi:hypothetical protein
MLTEYLRSRVRRAIVKKELQIDASLYTLLRVEFKTEVQH